MRYIDFLVLIYYYILILLNYGKKKSNKMTNYIAKVIIILYNVNKLLYGTEDIYARRKKE